MLRPSLPLTGKNVGESLVYHYRWTAPGREHPAWERLTFAGRWKTPWGIVELRLRGRYVTGTYPHDGGKITGELSPDGRTLTGTWSEGPTCQAPKDAGDVLFELGDDGNSFSGRYWYGPRTADVPGRAWNGTRLDRLE